jgi:hypothetical protein
VKAEREAETVGQREPIIDGVAGIERIVLLACLARDDCPAVRGDGQPHVGRARFDSAFEP